LNSENWCGNFKQIIYEHVITVTDSAYKNYAAALHLVDCSLLVQVRWPMLCAAPLLPQENTSCAAQGCVQPTLRTTARYSEI